MSALDQLWHADGRATTPSSMTPAAASQVVADTAAVFGTSREEALGVAVATIVCIDRHRRYPDAMAHLRRAFDDGELRAEGGGPLSRAVTWPVVVEVAETATWLARPMVVDRWRSEVLSSYARGEGGDLEQLFGLAPRSTLNAYLHASQLLEVDDGDRGWHVWAQRVVRGLGPIVKL